LRQQNPGTLVQWLFRSTLEILSNDWGWLGCPTLADQFYFGWLNIGGSPQVICYTMVTRPWSTARWIKIWGWTSANDWGRQLWQTTSMDTGLLPSIGPHVKTSEIQYPDPEVYDHFPPFRITTNRPCDMGTSIISITVIDLKLPEAIGFS
jgi:hypothetical protein